MPTNRSRRGDDEREPEGKGTGEDEVAQRIPASAVDSADQDDDSEQRHHAISSRHSPSRADGILRTNDSKARCTPGCGTATAPMSPSAKGAAEQPNQVGRRSRPGLVRLRREQERTGPARLAPGLTRSRDSRLRWYRPRRVATRRS